jgi:hypothetical protein
MDNVIRRGYECPRWMTDHPVNVPAGQEIVVGSSNFENNTIYKQRLIYLSFTKERESPADPPGQWFRRLKLELGKSGCSDQNLVKGSIAALCAHPLMQRQKFGAYNCGRDIKLRTPYLLPRDCRLNVKYWNRSPNLTISTYATFVAMGRTLLGGDPVVLAGEGVETLLPGQSQIMRSADLRNNGRREILIERLIFKSFDFDVAGETGYDETGTWIGWQVNPDVGTQWMPIDMSIPVGNLTPLARNDNLSDRGPRVYIYPHETWLYPKQALSIKLTNDSAVDGSVNICMHTEMEVR